MGPRGGGGGREGGGGGGGGLGRGGVEGGTEGGPVGGGAHCWAGGAAELLVKLWAKLDGQASVWAEKGCWRERVRACEVGLECAVHAPVSEFGLSQPSAPTQQEPRPKLGSKSHIDPPTTPPFTLSQPRHSFT